MIRHGHRCHRQGLRTRTPPSARRSGRNSRGARQPRPHFEWPAPRASDCRAHRGQERARAGPPPPTEPRRRAVPLRGGPRTAPRRRSARGGSHILYDQICNTLHVVVVGPAAALPWLPRPPHYQEGGLKALPLPMGTSPARRSPPGIQYRPHGAPRASCSPGSPGSGCRGWCCGSTCTG